MNDRKKQKIFCIGAPKTGTTSLAEALSRLGYRHKGWDSHLRDRYKAGDREAVYQVAEEYDSFDDGPWNNDDLYKYLDERFPGSKFILTVREPKSWIRSFETHFTSRRLRRRPYLLIRWPHSKKRRQEELDRYLKRNEEVKRYFADRPDDFLIIDVCGGEGYEKLCPFLGLPAREGRFPRVNTTSGRAHTTVQIWQELIRVWRMEARAKASRMLKPMLQRAGLMAR